MFTFYQYTFTKDSRGLLYWKDEREIKGNQSLKDVAVGYVNGTLLEILSGKKTLWDWLKVGVAWILIDLTVQERIDERY
ncbi:MAG: hypothetical protein SV375_07025 [Thermodesulfobacteriota bacterium]|nr:hypothetical protein [Thermodesulfobacteriota bacterium]